MKMGPKTKFVLSFMPCSLALFTFRQQLFEGYTWFLQSCISFFNPSYLFHPEITALLYGYSMTMIAFISLVLSTPGVKLLKKAVVISSGLLLFLMLDFFAIQYIVFPQTGSSGEDSFGIEFYFALKWILPFTIWLFTASMFTGGFFNLRPDQGSEAS